MGKLLYLVTARSPSLVWDITKKKISLLHLNEIRNQVVIPVLRFFMLTPARRDQNLSSLYQFFVCSLFCWKVAESDERKNLS